MININRPNKGLIEIIAFSITVFITGVGSYFLGRKHGSDVKDDKLEEAYRKGTSDQLSKDEECLIKNECMFFNEVKSYSLGMAVYNDAEVSTEPNCLTNLKVVLMSSPRPADCRYFHEETDKHLTVEHAIADYSRFLSSLPEADKNTCLAQTNTFMQQLADELHIPVNKLWSNFYKVTV